MTPLPKRRWSRARQGQRRTTIKLKTNQLQVCPHCQALKEPFVVCSNCGYYNGVQVITPKVEKPAKNEKPS
ncbi:50S ribosomal protein L32 [Candidatus Microgenomates bacterium]|nr:50S ribosomal protein L32 [Candidatus Microgenomates bacterium]